MAKGWDKSTDEIKDRGYATSRRTGKKKNTSTWCKGKVGVPHQPVLVMGQNYGHACHLVGVYDPKAKTWTKNDAWYCYHVMACAVCGKHLRNPDRCPDVPNDTIRTTFRAYF